MSNPIIIIATKDPEEMARINAEISRASKDSAQKPAKHKMKAGEQ
jgi:hypothetical protein